ncbi:MAG: hypothetical protein UU26_C0002G0089 [Candidatus Daviesbacteria bacterium GW2011_GWC1_40_9]|nr:MAG: hypothetical protein UU26_C0002G0089 [Candidatus Daviesbacteria bacterium GW2011_GWC1_40_9]
MILVVKVSSFALRFRRDKPLRFLVIHLGCKDRNLTPSGSLRHGGFLYDIIELWPGEFYFFKQQEVNILLRSLLKSRTETRLQKLIFR